MTYHRTTTLLQCVSYAHLQNVRCKGIYDNYTCSGVRGAGIYDYTSSGVRGVGLMDYITATHHQLVAGGLRMTYDRTTTLL